MRFSLSAVILIICIMIFSIFVANVTNLINIDRNLSKKHNSASTLQTKNNEHHSRYVPLDDGVNHLMWFLQISDIHISIFGDDQRIKQFREFVGETLDVIEPTVVLASGDLTDAKDSDHLGSRQYRDEWQIYHDIIQQGHVQNKTIWLDIRGNHDNFNVPGVGSTMNYFRNYSVQGPHHKRSYLQQVDKGGVKYSFIAVDACLEPGPKRPFNFIGVLSLNDTKHIVGLAEQARRNGGNYTIWFGHYPTSCIVSMETGSWGLRRLIGQYDEGLAYLCGHLHKLGGMVPRMYTLQHDGFLELELGDWKANRTYRVAAIDHGLFSFVDVLHNEWPVVLVTNPKHALFHMPEKEHHRLQAESTHIRILAFSPASIDRCTLRINDQHWEVCKRIDKNLFVVKWNPDTYKKGVHKLEVLVSDTMGRQRWVVQPFTLDGSRVNFDLLARVALMSDASIVFRVLFGFALSMCVVPLCFFRAWHMLATAGRLSRPRMSSCRYPRSICRRFWILSSIDRLFYPVVGYCFYLTVGPWSIGEVIDGHMGIIFSWGIYVNGGYLPGSLTYLYGFFQLLLCQLPLICIFANCVDARYRQHVGIAEPSKGCCGRKCVHAPFVLIIVVELVLAIFFWNAYGTLAFLLGPFRTWSVVMNAVVWHMARNVPDKCLSSAAKIWSLSERKISTNNQSVPPRPSQL